MENPVARVCNEQNLTRSQLCILANCDRSKIHQVESGAAQSIRGKLLDAIVTLGYDRAAIIREYAVWRSHLAEQIRSQHITA